MLSMQTWLPFFDLAVVALATLFWLFMPQAGPWPLIIGLAPWLFRGILTGRPSMRTPFDIPLLLFLLLAGVSVWSAFDREVAWPKFWLIVSATLFFYMLANWQSARRSNRTFQPLWIFALIGAGSAAYFVIGNDWVTYPGKIAVLTSIGQTLQAPLGKLPLERLHPNILAAVMAMTVPYEVAIIFLSRRNGSLTGVLVGVIILVVTLVGLLLTTARGAWIALVVAATLLGWWHLSRKISHQRRTHRKIFFAVIVAAVVLSLLLLILIPALIERIFLNLPAPIAGLSRVDLYRNSLALVGDYPLVGAGLGNFMMLYSTYSLLLHVGFLSHSHNLVFDLIIEQGAFALFLMCWMWLMLAEAVWRSMAVERVRNNSQEEPAATDRRGSVHGRRLILGAAALSLVIMLTHGMVDDAVYGSRAIVLLFSPLAFSIPFLQRKRRRGWRFDRITLLATAGALLLLVVFWGRSLLSTGYANMAAVQQSKDELSLYSWPEWPVQDAVRREIDLSSSIELYEHALDLNPENASAARRLGQIELSRGLYPGALDHLRVAYLGAPWDNATRQLLGEALIVNGQIEQGRAFWETISNAQRQLSLRLAWYEMIQENVHAENIRMVIDQIGN